MDYVSMYSILMQIYSLGEDLFSNVYAFNEIFFYEVMDGVSLMSLVLPASITAYILVQLVSWLTDTVS